MTDWIVLACAAGAAAISTYLFFGSYHYRWRQDAERIVTESDPHTELNRRMSGLLDSLECTDESVRALEDRVAALERAGSPETNANERNLRDRIAEQLIAHPMGLVPVDHTDTTWPWAMADALIAALGLTEQLSVEYIHAPKYANRLLGLDVCGDCGEAVSHDRTSADALVEMLASRDSRFKAKIVHRYVTDWMGDE